MRILVNHSSEDRPYLPALIPLMKEEMLSGVATNKTYKIGELQEAAKKQKCEAILLSNQGTLQELLGEDARLSDYRGTRINYTIPVIVISPIEHTHTVNHGRWLLQQDLKKFRRVHEKSQPFAFEVLETTEQMENAQLILETCILISFDIETNEKLQITCISYTGLLPDLTICCYILPFIDFGVDHFSDDDLYAFALQTMRDINRNSVPKIAFNGQYDATYCITYHAEPNNFVIDPMILGWAEFSELPRSLEFNASLNCYDYFFWKDEADKAKQLKDKRSYWAYCAKDSWYTLRIALEQMKTKPEYAFVNYQKIFHLIYPALYMGFEGILIDEEKRKENREKAVKKKLEALNNLQLMAADPEFNPGSWQQVSKFIYGTIGAKRIPGAPSAGTDEKVLNRVAVQHPLLARIIDEIVTYRGQAKLISTYFDIIQKNGRLLYAVDPSGAETARSTSKASAFWCGTQIQNQPRGPEVKEWLVADPGFTLLEPDKNKSEARCVGYLSEGVDFIADIENPTQDFYKVVAAKFFNISYDEVTPELRNDITKHVIHGTHHMGGANQFINTVTPKRLFGIMSKLNFPAKNLDTFAKYLMDLYHKLYPQVRTNLWTQVKSDLQRTHKLVSPLGWVRYCFGDVNKHHAIFRSGVAHMSQNLSVELINKSVWRIYKDLVVKSNGNIRLKAQIHDSILIQCREGTELETAKKMLPLLNISCQVHGRTMLIPSDFKVGKRWGDMHGLKLST